MFLFAPTVPSEPRPKKTARTVPGGSMSSDGSYGRLMPDTSSVMPMVNRRRGRSRASSANTPGDHARGELLRRQAVPAAGHQGQHLALAAGVRLGQRGDHVEEERLAGRAGSLVRSSTATRRAVAGSASSSARAGNGRYSRTCSTPDPLALRAQVGHGLAGGLRGRAHHHDHPLGLRMAGVIHDRGSGGRCARPARPSRPAPRRARRRRTGSPSPAPGSRRPGSARCRG